jgi:hypothetical protein
VLVLLSFSEVWLQTQAKVVYNGTAVFGSITLDCVAAATLASMTDVSSVVIRFKVDLNIPLLRGCLVLLSYSEVWLQMQAKMVYNGTVVFGPVTLDCVAAATLASMTNVSITPARLVAGVLVEITVTPQVFSRV